MPETDPIQLEDFVRSVLVSLVKGVADAQDEVKGTGAVINPQSGRDHTNKPVRVDIDVAITAASRKGEKRGLAVAVSAIGIGKAKTTEAADNRVSRVSFAVDVALPVGGQMPHYEGDGKRTPRES